MYGYDTCEWTAILIFILTAIMIVGVFAYEMWSAHKAKKAFDESQKNNDVGLVWATIENGDIDYSDPKDRVYDWKKDAPNDFS